jgi:hypothetical protein
MVYVERLNTYIDPCKPGNPGNVHATRRIPQGVSLSLSGSRDGESGE